MEQRNQAELEQSEDLSEFLSYLNDTEKTLLDRKYQVQMEISKLILAFSGVGLAFCMTVTKYFGLNGLTDKLLLGMAIVPFVLTITFILIGSFLSESSIAASLKLIHMYQKTKGSSEETEELNTENESLLWWVDRWSSITKGIFFIGLFFMTFFGLVIAMRGE